MAGSDYPTQPQDPWLQVPPEVAPVLRACVSHARDRVIGAVRSEVPAYDQPLEAEFGQVFGEAVDGALNRFIDMIERRDADALGPSRPLFDRLGRLAFCEGRTLDVLLRAYQIGSRAAWREMVAACTSAAVHPAIVHQLADTLLAYVTEMSAASSEGYSAESASAAYATQSAREELVELLVVRPPASTEELSEAGRAADYPLPGRLAALAVSEGNPYELATRIGPSAIAARLAARVCVLLEDADKKGLARALQREDAALGPTVPLEQLSQSWEWARRALDLIGDGTIAQRGIVPVEDHFTTIFLHGDAQLGRALAARWLAPLEQVGERSRQALPETLLAWLAYDRSFTSAAQALHVHPHTIRYRLDKLRSLYGGILDDPGARFELELALRITGLRVQPTPTPLPQPPDGPGPARGQR